MYLFFDTETTGLPKDWKAHVHDVDNWPRMIQLAWLMAGDDGKTQISSNQIIIPEGFEIPDEVSTIHGITTDRAISEGFPLAYALGQFSFALSLCNDLVAHNVNFDKKIIGAEFLRLNLEDVYQGIKDIDKTCTMMKTTKFVGLKQPNSNRPKWPTLQELHTKLFDEPFDGAHDAMADVKAMAKCFFEIKKIDPDVLAAKPVSVSTQTFC
jgi:DNA polymerase III epsilon subunit-like protein